jgi:NADPH:quinone reductase-like Zn-dependent oxidoreductase
MQAIHLSEFVTSLAAIRPSTVPLLEPSPTTLIIRVTHVSPTHVDILYAQGKHQNNRRHAKPPFVLGMDFAGIVSTAPRGSEYVKGDRVYGSHFGAFAEFVGIDIRNPASSIRKVPRNWTNEQACAVGASGAISLGCYLRAGGIKRDDWVLVTGASGGLGVIACQIAQAMGGKVIALVDEETGEKASVLRQVGVEAFVSYNEKAWESKVHDISRGGVAIVYDGVGLVERGLRCCKFGGTVVIVGFAGRGGNMEELKVNRILLKGAGVIGYVSLATLLIPTY